MSYANPRTAERLTHPAHLLQIDGIVDQILEVGVTGHHHLGQAGVHLGADQHQRQLGGAHVCALGVARQNLQLHFQLVQLQRVIVELAAVHGMGGVAQNVIDQPQAGQRRHRRHAHLDAQLVGNDVGHALQIAGGAATLR